MSFQAIDQLLSSSSPLLRQRREEEEHEDDRDEGLRPSKTLYLSENPPPVDFYQEETGNRDVMIDIGGGGGGGGGDGRRRRQNTILDESSGEYPDMKGPKKRAETWVQQETRCLINLRREMNGLFNTSKRNKHLWEKISSKMREKGFYRSPTMCTEKWRNLLKDFKKAKQHYKGSGSAKMSYYRELGELLKERSKNVVTGVGKANPFVPFVDKGGDNHASYGGRIILVKCGEHTKRIGIDGTTEAIKEAIKSSFGLRTKRAFWLEDEDEVVRCLDREMLLGTYTLHLDAGNDDI